MTFRCWCQFVVCFCRCCFCWGPNMQVGRDAWANVAHGGCGFTRKESVFQLTLLPRHCSWLPVFWGGGDTFCYLYRGRENIKWGKTSRQRIESGDTLDHFTDIWDELTCRYWAMASLAKRWGLCISCMGCSGLQGASSKTCFRLTDSFNLFPVRSHSHLLCLFKSAARYFTVSCRLLPRT